MSNDVYNNCIQLIEANARLLYGRHLRYDVVVGHETAMKCRICLIGYGVHKSKRDAGKVLHIVDSDICKKYDKWDESLDHVSQSILRLVEELGAEVAEKTGCYEVGMEVAR